MRIPLILTAALAVAASTAAAAGIDLNADDPTLDDLSSGTSSIEDCTNGLHLDVLHSDTYDDTVNDWYVTGVRITAADHDTGGSILDDCLDMALSVAIDDDQDTNLVVLGPVVLTTDTITDGTIELPVGDDTLIPVRDAHQIAALADLSIDSADETIIAAGGICDVHLPISDGMAFGNRLHDVASGQIVGIEILTHGLVDGIDTTSPAQVPLRVRAYEGHPTDLATAAPVLDITTNVAISREPLSWADVHFPDPLNLLGTAQLTLLVTTDEWGAYTQPDGEYNRGFFLCATSSDLSPDVTAVRLWSDETTESAGLEYPGQVHEALIRPSFG